SPIEYTQKRWSTNIMLWALILSLSLADAAITGVVKDASGGAVSGAAVTVKTASGVELQAVTGPDGRFTFDRTPDGATIVVRAGGFAERIEPLGNRHEIEIVLSPATLLETVTVTPTRSEQRLGAVPAGVNLLDTDQIRQSPAVVADDVLR